MNAALAIVVFAALCFVCVYVYFVLPRRRREQRIQEMRRDALERRAQARAASQARQVERARLAELEAAAERIRVERESQQRQVEREVQTLQEVIEHSPRPRKKRVRKKKTPEPQKSVWDFIGEEE